MSEWIEYRAGDHMTCLSGFPFSSQFFETNEGTRLIRIRDLLDDRADRIFFRGLYDARWLVKANDVLIGMDGEFNVVRWRGEPALLNQRILKVSPRADSSIDLGFFYYWCGPYLKKVEGRTAATTVKHLSVSDVERALVLAPRKPEQQRRIAEILTTVDEAIEQTEALIAKQQQVKAGLMHDLFTRGLTADGQLRPSRADAPDRYYKTPLGWLPKEWRMEPLATFAATRGGSFVNGPFGSDLLTSELTDSGVPVIYVQDIAENEYRRVSKAFVTDSKADQLSVCNVRNGDVVISKVGDPPGIAMVYWLSERAIITQDVIRIRPAEDVDPEFLASMLNSSLGRKAIQRIVIEGTRARVSLTEFKKLWFPKPEAGEQSAVGARIASVSGGIAAEAAHLAKLRQVKQALMQALLTPPA